MTIATKGGGLIVKDGRLAQNCGCCSPPVCSLPALPDSVVVELTSSGTTGYGSAKLRHYARPPTLFSDFSVAFACVAPRSGTYVLTGSGTTYSYSAPGIQILAQYRTFQSFPPFWFRWDIVVTANPYRISQNLGNTPLTQSDLEDDYWFSTSCTSETFTTASGLTLPTCWRLGGSFSTAGNIVFDIANDCRNSIFTRRKGAAGTPAFSLPITANSGCLPPFGVSGTIAGIGRLPAQPGFGPLSITEDEDTAKTSNQVSIYVKEKTNATVSGSALTANSCDFALSVESVVAIYGPDEVPFFDPRFQVSC